MFRGVTFVAVAAVAWGSGGVVASILYRTSGLGPIAVSCWRLGLGAAILAAGLAIRRGARPGGGGVITGIGLAVSQTAYFASVAEAGVAVGTVVTIGTGPVLVALAERYALGERVRAATVPAIGAALGGLVLLAGGTAGGDGVGRRPALGIGLALLSAAAYAAVTVVARARREAGDPYRTALSAFAVGAACLLPFAALEGLWPTGALGTTAGWLLYLGAVPTALGYGLFFAGLATVRATTASVVVLLEPVTAAVAAIAVLGERLSGPTLAGTLVLLGAIVALATEERRSHQGGGTVHSC